MALFRRPTPATPLDGIDAIFADLDGVVYAGQNAIPHAVESLNRAAESMTVGYVTNNAARTDATVAAQLSGFGLDVSAEQVITSPQAAVRLLADLIPAGSTVLAVGGEGLVVELERGGFTVTRSGTDNPVAVVQGFAPEVSWTDLAEAAFVLQPRDDGTELPWIATNTDWTIPRERGIAPGNGTLVSAVHTAIGRLATVAGKPEVPIFEEARRRFGAANPLFIGDRLDTDIRGANSAEMRSVLVLTGIDQAKHVLAADPKSRPTFILEDLRQLHEPYPETVMSRGGSRAKVRDAVVRIEGTEVIIEREGDNGIDLLRAGSAAIWASGRAIFGFNVPEQLYS